MPGRSSHFNKTELTRSIDVFGITDPNNDSQRRRAVRIVARESSDDDRPTKEIEVRLELEDAKRLLHDLIKETSTLHAIHNHVAACDNMPRFLKEYFDYYGYRVRKKNE